MSSDADRRTASRCEGEVHRLQRPVHVPERDAGTDRDRSTRNVDSHAVQTADVDCDLRALREALERVPPAADRKRDTLIAHPIDHRRDGRFALAQRAQRRADGGAKIEGRQE
jgi:hypothetical protein